MVLKLISVELSFLLFLSFLSQQKSIFCRLVATNFYKTKILSLVYSVGHCALKSKKVQFQDIWRKSTYFDNIFKRSGEKITKNVDFSLRGNHAITQTTCYILLPYFSILAHYMMHMHYYSTSFLSINITSVY